MNKKLIRNDIILITFISIILFFLSILIYRPSNFDTAYISVTLDSKPYKEYLLDKDINEEIGKTGVYITIKNEKAYISSSGCQDKLCLKFPKIDINSPHGTSIVCLPNRISLTKKNANTSEGVDVIAG